jgi:hypothetical protein
VQAGAIGQGIDACFPITPSTACIASLIARSILLFHNSLLQQKNRSKREGQMSAITPTLTHACPHERVPFSSGKLPC